MALSERDTLRYRWEFMRRNKDYGRLYGLLSSIWELAVAATKNDDPARCTGALKAYEEAARPLNEEFQKRFGFEWFKPLHPERTFEEIEPSLQEIEQKLFARQFSESSSCVAHHFIDSDSNLTIKVDLSKLNRTSTVLPEIKRILSDALEEYERYTGDETLNPRDPELILRIGDLHEKLGSPKAVADLVFPDEKDTRNGENKVCQHLKTYRFLVNGGFNKLSVP